MSSRLHHWSEAFLKQGLYLRNWSVRTSRTYAQAFVSLSAWGGIEDLPTKSELERWVLWLREKGVSPSGVNMYLRTVNSFLSWLQEEGHLDHRLRIKLLRAPQKQLTMLSPQELKAILGFKPQTSSQRRTWTLILLLLDTGIRIDEALGIERARVDLDSLTLVVWGKGAKERRVPFSLEMRKVLFRWLQGSTQRYVFHTGSGTRYAYRNAYRDIEMLCARIGVQAHVHPHLFRHQFASSYISRGGDIYRLSRVLGHTTITTTQLYLRSMGIEQIRANHDTLSPLSVRG